MPTDDTSMETLRRNLTRLQEELQSSGELDSDARQRLEAAIEDIESALNGEDDSHSLGAQIERLEDMPRQFEVDHPRLAEATAMIIDTLSKLGI